MRVLEFDGDVVVFNPTSWQTHILNDSAGLVLKALRNAPQSRDQLVALLDSATSGEADRQLVRDAVDNLLVEFASAGLIEPAAL
jgi:PqqD family protein of HPr-rel-A system